MPELPEVETVKRGLEPFLDQAVITDVILNRDNLRYPFPKDMVARLKNKRCIGLRRRGKYIWIDFEDGQTTWVVHLGMSGNFTVNAESSSKHDHVIVTTDRGDVITYNDPRRFGMMYFVTTGKEADHPSFATMGVEPLGNGFNGDVLYRLLNLKKKPIKAALLDQSVIAGIGNIYACEALYEAGIHPETLACHLDRNEVHHLSQAIRAVLQSALASGGSSLRDHKMVNGESGYFQHHFKVYGKNGLVCEETGGVIEKIVQSGRSTFFCAQKQKKKDVSNA